MVENQQSPLFVDALPYVDKEYTPEMQTAVSQMVRDELKRNPRQLQDPTHHRELLDNQFPPANELLRKSRTTMINVCADEPPAPANTAIDLDRYNFSVTEDLLHSTDPTRWSEAVDRLKGKLEYERDGLLNLELLQKFGGNAWKIHNYQLESQVELLDRLLDEAKDSMQQVNKRRKVEQLKSGKELMRLTQQWQELVESKRQVQLENERLLSIALQQQSANQ